MVRPSTFIRFNTPFGVASTFSGKVIRQGVKLKTGLETVYGQIEEIATYFQLHQAGWQPLQIARGARASIAFAVYLQWQPLEMEEHRLMVVVLLLLLWTNNLGCTSSLWKVLMKLEAFHIFPEWRKEKAKKKNYKDFSVNKYFLSPKRKKILTIILWIIATIHLHRLREFLHGQWWRYQVHLINTAARVARWVLDCHLHKSDHESCYDMYPPVS